MILKYMGWTEKLIEMLGNDQVFGYRANQLENNELSFWMTLNYMGWTE